MAQPSALVSPVSDRQASWLSRIVFWMARRKLRALTSEPRVPGPLRVMAHHPTAMLTYGSFEAGLERCTRVPARLKSLAMIRAATLVGCPF